ncbi:MAG: hypothetical protein GY908_10725 [Flavobacteriales bacterium]|nr:hypothetical protein [Flavobacteriales bacterium]
MIDQIQKNNVNVNLLWTGGWDSTFQLLQLLLIYKVSVTPFYLIDKTRRSTLKEIESMSKIKNQLISEYPYVKKLIKATRYHSVDDISPNKTITDSFQSLLKKAKIGIQHEWLARFCFEHGIENMQLSVEAAIILKPTQFFGNHIKPFLITKKIGNQEVYLLDSKLKNCDEYNVFKYFIFPVIYLTKVQMNEIVNKKGWMKIMEMTWFCHNPIHNDKPCGICRPCIVLQEESFGWRIPARRRFISTYKRKIFWPFKSMVKSNLVKMGLFSNKMQV